MKILPGQFRIHGRKPRAGEATPQLDVLVGPEVGNEAEAFLRRQFLGPRLTFQHVVRPEFLPYPSFRDELASRGYDLATFRLSILAKNHGQRIPRPRILQIRKGVLCGRWSWVEHDHSPDLVCTWALPCHKADCNLLLGLLSMPSLATRSRGAGFASFASEMDRLGMDVRTFRFEIRHRDGVAPGHPAPLEAAGYTESLKNDPAPA